jgi:hypothetical protein
VLLVLYTLATFAREAGMRQVTYQTVLGLFDTCQPLLRLLANIDRIMVWKPGAAIDFALTRNKTQQASYIGVAKALLRNAQRAAPATLGHILCDHAVSGDLDRIVFLKLLAPRLNGRLAPIADPADAGGPLRHPRAAAQHWALQHLSADMLTLGAEMRFRPAAGK